MAESPISTTSARHIFLVHGLCHGGWCWYKVATQLGCLQSPAGRPWRVVALDLAASGIDGRQLREVPTFRDYTAPLLDALRSLPDGEKAILVGHSLGGFNVALAAEEFPEKVAAAVFLCAYMPDCTSPPGSVLVEHGKRNRGQSQLDNEIKPQDAEGKLPASFMFGPRVIEQNVYQLCSNEDITLAKSVMRVGSMFLEDLQVMEPFSKDRYGSVHKVYIIGNQDRALPEEFQRWMVSNNPVDEVKEIDGADHMAMLSTPDEVVQCIVDITGNTADLP